MGRSQMHGFMKGDESINTTGEIRKSNKPMD